MNAAASRTWALHRSLGSQTHRLRFLVPPSALFASMASNAAAAAAAPPSSKPAAAGRPSDNKKEVKILMLHGYTQSGPLFRAKTRALEKMLAKSLAPFRLAPVLVYPTAPNRLRPREIPGYQAPAGAGEEEEETLDAWAWWRRDDGTGLYRFFSEGMGSLAAALREAGGVDGVLGFSQGATAASLLAAALEQQPPRPCPAAPPAAAAAATAAAAYDWSWVDAVRAANGHRALRFAVLYSGFFAPPAELAWLYDPPIATPTLHYIGGLDTVVEESRSRALVERTVDPVVLTHPGGHYVPISKEWVMPLVAFVKSHAASPDADAAAAAADDVKTKI